MFNPTGGGRLPPAKSIPERRVRQSSPPCAPARVHSLMPQNRGAGWIGTAQSSASIQCTAIRRDVSVSGSCATRSPVFSTCAPPGRFGSMAVLIAALDRMIVFARRFMRRFDKFGREDVRCGDGVSRPTVSLPPGIPAPVSRPSGRKLPDSNCLSTCPLTIRLEGPWARSMCLTIGPLRAGFFS